MTNLIFLLLALSSSVFAGGNGQIISAQSPLVLSNGLLSMPPSTNSVSGYLTAADHAKFSGSSGSAITKLSGDVSATGPGAVLSTVNSVGGSVASAVHSATLLANAATNANTASTIVKRDASGNFAAGSITASLIGHASLDLPLSGGTIGGDLQVNGIVTITSGSGFGSINRPDGAGVALSVGNGINSYLGQANFRNASSTTLNASISDAGVVFLNSLSASTVVVADGSKNLASLPYGSGNTAGAFVQRDVSGNFSAGIITAQDKLRVQSSSSPILSWNIPATQEWVAGIDISDSNAWKLSSSSALGTSNVIRIDTNGIVLLRAALDVSSDGILVGGVAPQATTPNGLSGGGVVSGTSVNIAASQATPGVGSNLIIQGGGSGNQGANIWMQDGNSDSTYRGVRIEKVGNNFSMSNYNEADATNRYTFFNAVVGNSGGGALTFGATGATPIHRFNALTQSPASGVLTFTNGPGSSSGNPSVYLTLNINGTNYAFPGFAF